MYKNEVFKTQNAQIVADIKYPRFSYSGGKSKKIDRLCKNMNDYYLKTVQVLCEKAKKILSDKGANERSKIEMNYKLSLVNEKIISVILDISFENKKGVRKKRFSQNWSVKDGTVMPACFVMKMTLGTRKKVLSFVFEMAKQNSKNSAFGYYADFISRLRRSFSLKRFFVTPKGVAFYVDAGVLSDVKQGSFAFVVPYEKLGDFLKKGIMDELCKEENVVGDENNEEICTK